MSLVAAVQTLDESILRAAYSTPAWGVPIFYVFTTIGAGWGLLFVIPFLARKPWRRVTAWCLSAIVATSATTSVVKEIVARVRPCHALAWCAPILIATPPGFSFPSGHASGSFAFAAFVSARRPSFAVLVIPYAMLVAWSRCVLGAHYPSDVIGGAILGVAIGLSFAVALSRRDAGVASRVAPIAKSER